MIRLIMGTFVKKFKLLNVILLLLLLELPEQLTDLYDKFRRESLRSGRNARRICAFQKILKTFLTLEYLFKLFPRVTHIIYEEH